MSQHDFDIANQSASSARADINNALKALASVSAGSTSPATTYAYMFWLDTDTNVGTNVSSLKMRSADDTDWITLLHVDHDNGTVYYVAGRDVVNFTGSVRGSLDQQATATWEAGTGNTESFVSPAKIKAAVLAHAPSTSYTDAQARSAQSGHSVGDVGSYAWLSYSNGSPTTVTFNPGDTTGGANLKYAGSGSSSTSGPSGTWRCMGFISVLQNQTQSTLWLRIS